MILKLFCASAMAKALSFFKLNQSEKSLAMSVAYTTQQIALGNTGKTLWKYFCEDRDNMKNITQKRNTANLPF